MYPQLHEIHNILPYLILVLLLIVLFRSALGHIANREYTQFDNRSALVLVMFVHLQFVLGVALFFLNPGIQEALKDMGALMKDETMRFMAVEHTTIMLLAVVVITIGRIWSKRAKLAQMKHRRALICYAIGFLFIIAGIPWEKMFQ